MNTEKHSCLSLVCPHNRESRGLEFNVQTLCLYAIEKCIMGSMGNIVKAYGNLFLHIWDLWVKYVIEVFFFSGSRRDERADIPHWPEGRVGEGSKTTFIKIY